MLTINELKNKLLFTQNIRRILESLKLIAAMNMKKYTNKYKHAHKLSAFVGIESLKQLLQQNNTNAKENLSVLNIVISAQSGLCGNFMIDLNRLITEKVLGATIKMSDIIRDHLHSHHKSNPESNLSDSDLTNHLFKYDEISQNTDHELFCIQHIQSWLQEELDHALIKHKEDKWILIGNKIPDVLKHVTLHHHMPLEKNLLANIMTLSHMLAELEGHIEVINIIGWNLNDTYPAIRRISLLDYDIQHFQQHVSDTETTEQFHTSTEYTMHNVNYHKSSSLSQITPNADQDLLISDPDRYNRFMMESIMYFNSCILASLAREDKIRFFTMDQAINNTDEMTQRLKNDVNQTRQGLITNELIEIITGAEFA